MSVGAVTHLDQAPGGSGKPQDEPSRYDRELIELLNELRVVLPGVQVLFAFLLIVPFNDRFGAVDGPLRIVYLIALMASALACVFFVTPPCFHRLRFRRRDKAQLLQIGNRCALAGCFALGVAMVSSVALLTVYLFGAAAGVTLTAIVAVAITGLWWILPVGFGARPDDLDENSEEH